MKNYENFNPYPLEIPQDVQNELEKDAKNNE
jgi:hypothetical protein